MQRHPPSPIRLEAGDLVAAEPARTVDADAFRAEAHGRLHGALHGAAERDGAFKLLGNRFGDESRVKLGLANLDDVEDDVALGEVAHCLAELLDVGALLAVSDARPRRTARHSAFLVGTST